MPELRHEHQVSVEQENTVPAGPDVVVSGHNPILDSGTVEA
jgi:hypothetical protein